MDKYIQVLESDESNVFAAMGIANVLAEHNKVYEAIEILKGVKEATPSHITVPNVLINLAHLNVVQDNFESAINLYKIALERYISGHGNLDCELYLAKAYFLYKQFEKCQELLKSLIMRFPSDLRLRFDLGNCLYEQAKETFNKEFRHVKETKEAISNLKQSEKLMDFFIHTTESGNYLSSNSSREHLSVCENQLYFMRKHCEERIGEVREMISQSEGYLKFDSEKERELKDTEDKKLKIVEEMQQDQDAERKKVSEEQLKKQELEQTLYEQFQKDAEDHIRKIEQEIQEGFAQKKKGGKSREVAQIERGDILSDDGFIPDAQFDDNDEKDDEDSNGDEGEFKPESKDESREKKKKDKKHKKDKKKHKKHHKKDKKSKKSHKEDEDMKEEEAKQEEGHPPLEAKPEAEEEDAEMRDEGETDEAAPKRRLQRLNRTIE